MSSQSKSFPNLPSEKGLLFDDRGLRNLLTWKYAPGHGISSVFWDIAATFTLNEN